MLGQIKAFQIKRRPASIAIAIIAITFSNIIFSQEKIEKIGDKTSKICIVGGGPAGVLTAYELKKKGFSNVTVFEKDNKLGGKCFDKEHKGEMYPLGAVQVGLQYQNFMRLMREVGEPLRKHLPVRVLKTGEKPGEKTITKLRKEYWPEGKRLHMLREARKLYCASKSFFPYEHNNYNGLPAEFDMPFSEFCEKNGVTDIQRWYEQYIVTYGYGELSEIPTTYALAYIGNPIGIGYYMGTDSHLRMPKNGYKAVVESAAKGLDVRVNTPVMSIKRDKSGIEVTTKDGLEKFDKLFVACPLKALCGKMEMSKEEETLVNNLKFQPYRVVTAISENLPKGIFIMPENSKKSRNGHVTLITNELKGKDNFTTFYIPEDASAAQPRNDAEVINALTEDMNGLGIKIDKLVDNVLWDDYFPHFKKPSEMYKIMNDLQGENNTFQVGSTCKFDIVHSSYEHILKLLDDKFTGERPSEWFSFQKNMMLWMNAEARHKHD